MPAPIPPQDAQKALQALGVTQTDLEAIRRSPLPQAQTLLDDLKKKAHRQYKKLALELHPDRTQGDQDKAEFFVLLGRVLEELDKTKVQAPVPVPTFQVTYTVDNGSYTWAGASPFTSWATTSTTTTPFSPAQVIRVVRMRPK